MVNKKRFEKPYLSFYTAPPLSYTRDYKMTKDRLDSLIASTLESKGFRVEIRQPSERGGGGVIDWIEKIYNFVLHHEWIMLTIKNIPLFIKVTKYFLKIFNNTYSAISNWYWSRKFRHDDFNRLLDITIYIYLDDYKTEPKYAFERLRSALIETWQIIPSINKELAKNFSDMIPSYNFNARWGSDAIIGISGYVNEDRIMLSIFKYIADLKPTYKAFGFSITKNVLFSWKNYKVHKNNDSLFWQ